MKTASQYLRIGKELHPQVFGTYFQYGHYYDIIGTCAIGAIWQAYDRGNPIEAGRDARDIMLELAGDLSLEHLSDNAQSCLLGRQIPTLDKAHWLVTELNDYCKWSREDIADELEALGY